MNENALKIILINALKNGLTLFGIAGVQVMQSYQPRQSGAEITPTLYIHKTGDNRYGLNGRSDKWVPDDPADPSVGKMVHKEQQQMLTTFQINGLIKTDITNLDQMTVTDLLNTAAEILAHETTRDFLKSKNVAILRIADITNPFFVDSRDQNESSPSFDVVLVHNHVRMSTTPVVETCEFGIYRV